MRIHSKELFVELTNKKNNILNGNELPLQIFNSRFSNFMFTDFDLILTKKIYQFTLDYLRINEQNNLIFYSIEPQANDLSYKEYNSYGILQIDYKDTPDNILSELHFNTSGNKFVNSIADICEEILLFSDSQNWAIYGNRNYECLVFASEERETLDRICPNNTSNIQNFGDLQEIFMSIFNQYDIEKLLKNYL